MTVNTFGKETNTFIRGDIPLPAWQQSITGNTTADYSRMPDGTWAFAVGTPGAADEESTGAIASPGY